MIDIEKFELVSSRYGTDKYEAVVENITDVTFKYFNIEVRLYNEDNVIIDTTYCGSINNFEPGAKVKFDFSVYDVAFSISMSIQ